MITTFYWVWSVIGLLIILTIFILLIIFLTISKKLYKLVVTIYDEQQEILNEVKNSINNIKQDNHEDDEELLIDSESDNSIETEIL